MVVPEAHREKEMAQVYGKFATKSNLLSSGTDTRDFIFRVVEQMSYAAQKDQRAQKRGDEQKVGATMDKRRSPDM